MIVKIKPLGKLTPLPNGRDYQVDTPIGRYRVYQNLDCSWGASFVGATGGAWEVITPPCSVANESLAEGVCTQHYEAMISSCLTESIEVKGGKNELVTSVDSQIVDYSDPVNLADLLQGAGG